jgi:hypothetical protein
VYAFGPDAVPVAREIKARRDGARFPKLEKWVEDGDENRPRPCAADFFNVVPYYKLAART